MTAAGLATTQERNAAIGAHFQRKWVPVAGATAPSSPSSPAPPVPLHSSSSSVSASLRAEANAVSPDLPPLLPDHHALPRTITRIPLDMAPRLQRAAQPYLQS